jgi:hypothetical protein
MAGFHDRLRELVADEIEARGATADPEFVGYVMSLVEIMPVEDAVSLVGRDLYDEFVRDQAVEARVEALER